MARVIGVTQFLNKSFTTYDFKGEWLETLGEPEKNFAAIIYGESGNGKTDFAVKLTKYLATFTRVDYFSFEEGISKTLQTAIRRNRMDEVTGKVMFLEKFTFDLLVERLSGKNSARAYVIDSLDYMNLTTQQYKKLRKLFPKKTIIIVSWSRSGLPKSQYAKDIEYMCDMKIYVEGFKAYPRSRFGGNKTFVIWDKKPTKGDQLSLLNPPISEDNNELVPTTEEIKEISVAYTEVKS